MPVRFLDLPHEVSELIALLLIQDPDNRLGPPSALLPLLLTCKHLNHRLNPAINHHFASLLFRSRFDSDAIRRRQPRLSLPTKAYATQLVRYCNALRVIRTGDIYHEHATQSLWVAFLMLIENDGRNGIHLRDWAHAYEFAHSWAFERLLGTAPNGSKTWPIDSNENALVLWILWMLTNESILANETVADRQRLIDTILPFVVMSYRYPSFHCPPNHFTTPVPELHVLFPTLPANPQHDSMRPPAHPFPYSLITAHGPYPLYLKPSNITVIHWWGIDISFSQIPCGLAATLIYFTRRDRILPVPGIPLNRADAIAHGRDGLTTEDIKELASFRGTVLPPRLTWESASSFPPGPFTANTVSSVPPYTSPLNPHDDRWNSARWDIDWIRWTTCLDPRRETIGLGACIPHLNSRPGLAGLREARLLRPRRECYDFGSMAGLWQGKLMLQGEDRHVALLSNPVRDPAFGEEWLQMYSFPVMMRLREYHCISPGEPIPKGHAKEGFNPRGPNVTPAPAGATRVSRLPGFDDGAQNAWFPWRMTYKGHTSNSHTLTFTCGDREYEYHRHSTARPSSFAHDERTCVHCGAKRSHYERKEQIRKERKKTDAEIEAMAASHEHLFGSIGLGLGKRRSLVSEDGSPIWDSGARPAEFDLEEEDDCTGVTDIVFVGETDPHHSEAWHPFYFYGRLRRWDGLIGILRLAPVPGLGAMFFHGYLVGSRNFVGTWRMAATEMGVPAWMNGFSMSKREDD